MAVHACRKAGYAISACATRQEALDLWQRHSGSIDVLFSDVVLPDGTGLDLADRFRADRPTLPILLCSAYSDERARWPIIAVKGYHYIQKPYPITQMLHALRAAVAQKPQPGP
jgi:CheY-like chemotaxis protein